MESEITYSICKLSVLGKKLEETCRKKYSGKWENGGKSEKK